MPDPISTAAKNRFVQAALEASDDCIKIIALDGSLQFMSEGGQRVMEVDDFEVLRGCPWPDFWQDKGNTDALAAIEAARAGRSARFEGFANTAKGNRRFWAVKVSPILGPDGGVEAILSVSRDITAMREAEEMQSLLKNELLHRIKNIIALVQAIASQTLHDDDTIAVAKPAFLARLGALAGAHDALTQESRATADLADVVDATAATNLHGRIRTSGPTVSLSSRSALAMALTFHELATNATKYGAISVPDGQVTIAWAVEDVNSEPSLVLRWREHGGPPVAKPQRKGFGSRMIEKALAVYVSGTVNVEYRPKGLVFTLCAPLQKLRRV